MIKPSQRINAIYHGNASMGLRENIVSEPVSSLPIREVLLVKRKTPVRETIRLMRERRLGCAIVVDSRNKPVGQVTERMVMRLLVERPAGLDETAEKIMESPVKLVPQDAPIGSMIRIMQKDAARYLCVVDEKGRAIGLTGQKGLMEYIAEYFPRQVKVQRLKSFMAWPEREGA